MDLALQNHTSYLKAEADRSFLLKGVKVAYAQFLPRVNLGAYYSDSRYKNPNLRPIYDPNTNTLIDRQVTKSSSSSWDVSFSQDLFLGFSRVYGLRRANLMLTGSDLSVRSSRNQIVRDVKTAVYTYLASKRLEEMYREVLELRKESLRLAKARHATGDVIELDVLQAEIDAGTAENDLETAKQRVESALEALNLVIGVDLRSRYDVEGAFEPVLPKVNPEKIITAALHQNPDYQSLENNIEIGEQDIRVAGANMLPTVSLVGRFSKQESGSGYNKFKLSPAEENRSIAVSINWTLFNRYENRYRKQQAEVDKRKAAWNRRDLGQQIISTIRSNWRDLTSIYDQLKVTAKTASWLDGSLRWNRSVID